MDDDKLTLNPKFENLEREENAELRFFCEAFSLLDAVNNSNLLLGFSTQVCESKDGKINWAQIPDLFPDGTEFATYVASIERIYQLIDQVVRSQRCWITPTRTRSLKIIAAEAHHYHKNDSKSLLEKGSVQNRKKRSSVQGNSKAKTLADAWKEMSTKLEELENYQNEFKSYHADFQKKNYLPHPDSWKVYSGTFAFIFATLLYSIFVV